ncbi:hypothetical protein Tco_0562059 [Tanacetum coccineum]
MPRGPILSFLKGQIWRIRKEYDYAMSLIGKAKDVSAIPNQPFILGFQNVKLSYLGVLWVLFELDSLASKEKFLNHTGVRSWFTDIIQVTSSFVNDEKIVWVLIEGLPIKIRVKELDAWLPNFQEDIQDVLSFDEESQEDDVANKADKTESDVDRVLKSNLQLVAQETPTSSKLLIISVYAPQELNERRDL